MLEHASLRRLNKVNKSVQFARERFWMNFNEANSALESRPSQAVSVRTTSRKSWGQDRTQKINLIESKNCNKIQLATFLTFKSTNFWIEFIYTYITVDYMFIFKDPLETRNVLPLKYVTAVVYKVRVKASSAGQEDWWPVNSVRSIRQQRELLCATRPHRARALETRPNNNLAFTLKLRQTICLQLSDWLLLMSDKQHHVTCVYNNIAAVVSCVKLAPQSLSIRLMFV